MKIILIADDEEAVRTLVAATLGNGLRYNLILAGDGEETMELVHKSMPELLLLDIMMPKKDGYDVCRELKKDPATKSIKVVMLTALAQESHHQKAMELGADHFMVKPFSPTALLQKVDELLDQAQ